MIQFYDAQIIGLKFLIHYKKKVFLLFILTFNQALVIPSFSILIIILFFLKFSQIP